MGNCQAAEISAVVIQHPDGKTERLYWPTTAEDVMKSNPGHHVAILTLCIAQDKQLQAGAGDNGGRSDVRFTRVRLLKPKDMLLIGQVYRLLSSQEVSKALKARKLEKMKRAQSELIKQQRQLQLPENQETGQLAEPRRTENQERDRQQESTASAASAAAAGGRARHWRPKLQSISEGLG